MDAALDREQEFERRANLAELRQEDLRRDVLVERRRAREERRKAKAQQVEDAVKGMRPYEAEPIVNEAAYSSTDSENYDVYASERVKKQYHYYVKVLPVASILQWCLEEPRWRGMFRKFAKRENNKVFTLLCCT